MSAEPPNSQTTATGSSTSAARLVAGQARCRVCQHADRARIELAMARGAGKRSTARAYGVSEASVWRHWQNHVPDKLKAARRVSVLKPGANLETLVNEESTSVLETLKIIRAALLWQLDQATQVEDRHGMAVLSAQLHKNLETVARLTGELVNRSEVVNVQLVLTQEYLELRNALVGALAPFPDARRAVAAVLHQIEADTTQRPAQPVLQGVSYTREPAGDAAVAS